MLNRHIIGDNLLLTLARLAGPPFFSSSIETPPYSDHLTQTEITLPAFAGERKYEAALHTLAGRLDTDFSVYRWKSENDPVLIYNMGGAENPFDKTLKNMYPEPDDAPGTLIAVRSPCQRNLKELKVAFQHFNTYVAMVAATTLLNEKIRAWLPGSGRARTAISGTSLGGFITNRHRLAFNTADAYIPFVAGARHGDIFLTSIAASKQARANPDLIRSRLNFDGEWRNAFNGAHNVFPVNGAYDRLNRREMQGPSYAPVEPEYWPGGHLYAYNRPQRMRAKIERCWLAG